MELWDLARNEKFCLAKKKKVQSILLVCSGWTVGRHIEFWLGELTVTRKSVVWPPEAFT